MMTIAAADIRLELLSKAPLDSWIALSEDETKIVAVGATFEEVARSELAGVSDPVILKPPKIGLPSLGVTLKIPYKKYPLHGGGVTYSAIRSVNIALPAKNAPRTKRFEAVIDSGASRCIFHASIGRFIGLEIERGPVEETLGITGVSAPCLHDI